MNNWKPNDTQSLFLKVLSDEPHTLAELAEMAGVEAFAPGAINPLKKKNLVANGNDRIIECPHCGAKRKVKTWKKF